MKIFQFKEPHVDLKLNYGTSGSSQVGASTKESSRYKSNQQYGLYAGVDKSTYQPTFTLEVNMEDVFGKETNDTRKKRVTDYAMYRDQHRTRSLQALSSLAPSHSNMVPGSSLF